MKLIGLLSDTHGYLDPAVLVHFKDCDEIWHAGDFGENVSEQLGDFKPLRGVYGNIDNATLRLKHPEDLFFYCEQVKVYITHIGGYPPRYNARVREVIKQQKPQLFIDGHSHILKVLYDKNFECLHINPGAAGRQGWHKVRTMIRFKVDGSRIFDLEVIEITKSE